ncbi:hypothetical protein PF002_g6378 [Phytophthora fragariae]|uniref:Uncharacterized protein n=1 Tax=Phytophthora fragariae TaxID=53985 RepID=A0A6A3ZYA4_9STRA|nr:hypothetical protein PF002_g6378 [Phytophthora fragariae]
MLAGGSVGAYNSPSSSRESDGDNDKVVKLDEVVQEHINTASDGVQWLLDNKCIKKYQIRSASTFLTLAREGKLDLMQQVARLHDKKRLTKDWIDKWDWAMEIAARLEDLSMVKWMAEHRYGREVLKRGKDDNVFVMTDIPRGAAKGGHIGGGWSTSLDKGGRMNTRLLW